MCYTDTYTQYTNSHVHSSSICLSIVSFKRTACVLADPWILYVICLSAIWKHLILDSPLLIVLWAPAQFYTRFIALHRRCCFTMRTPHVLFMRNETNASLAQSGPGSALIISSDQWLGMPPAEVHHPSPYPHPVCVPLRNQGPGAGTGTSASAMVSDRMELYTFPPRSHCCWLAACVGLRGTNTFHGAVLTTVASPAWGGNPQWALLPLLTHQLSSNLQDMGVPCCLCSLARTLGPWEGKSGQESPRSSLVLCLENPNTPIAQRFLSLPLT